MRTETELEKFLRHHMDGMGTLSDLRIEYGKTSPMTPYLAEADGLPTQKTLEAHRTLERIDASKGLQGRRGAVWTVYEETEDSGITHKGRRYARNSLKLYAGGRTKILGWIVSEDGSGVFAKTYLIKDGETI